MDVQISAITEKLKNLGCSNETFCAVAGISPAQLSRAQRGLTVISGPESLRLSEIVRALREIQEAAKPLPLSFRSVQEVQTLLEYHKCLVIWKTVPSVLGDPENPEQQDQSQ